ncbi:MAG: LPXTG cell wall anchor domain-containing protein, partial [Ruminococcus sp.]|nr:LPXTG cell wall anchor domain-containing protein [Ruminococcus sp.]
AITNNGVQYIPLSYADNGSALDEQPPEISVTNMITKKLQGTMPSTGGEGKIKYNVTGLAIMLSSSAVYYLIRRRRKKAS